MSQARSRGQESKPRSKVKLVAQSVNCFRWYKCSDTPPMKRSEPLFPPLGPGWAFDYFHKQNLAEVTPRLGKKKKKGMQLLPGTFGMITSWIFPLRTLPLKTLHCQIKSLSFGLHINKPMCRHSGQQSQGKPNTFTVLTKRPKV